MKLVGCGFGPLCGNGICAEERRRKKKSNGWSSRELELRIVGEI